MNTPALLSRRWLRVVAWCFGGLLALWVLAWIVVPPLVKSQTQSRLSDWLGRQVTIGSVAVSPWSLELTVRDLVVATADGKGVQFSVDRLYLDAQAQSLFQLAPVIDALTVDGPKARLTRLGEDHYDIDDIVSRLNQADEAPAVQTPRFALHNLTVNHGSMDFADRAVGQERLHTLRDLQISLAQVSNLDSERDVVVLPRLTFVLNGGRLDSQVHLSPFGPSLKADAEIKIRQLDIAPYRAYLANDLPVQAHGAIVDADLRLNFSQNPQTALALSGSVTVGQLQVQDLQGKPLFFADSLQLGLLDVRPLERSVRLSAMTLNAPQFQLVRAADGQLNFLPPAPAQKNESPWVATSADSGGVSVQENNARPATAPWALQLDTLTLKDATLDWTDLATAPATRLGLRDLQGTVSKLQWPMKSAATLDLKTRLLALTSAAAAPTAQISLHGDGTLDAGKAQLEITDFDLGWVAGYATPYLEPSVRGHASTHLNFAWDGARQSAVAHKLALRDVALVGDKVPAVTQANATGSSRGPSSADLPQFKLLELSDIRLEKQARSAYVGNVVLHKPSTGLRRDAAGQWMFEAWLKTAGPGAAARVAPAATKPAASSQVDAAKSLQPWKLQVGDFKLEDGQLVFSDRMPARPVRMEISGLQVQAKNFLPQGNTPMPLHVSANIKSGQAEAGKLRYTGTLMWDPVLVQGEVDALDVPAHAFAAYALSGLNLTVLRADTSFKGQVQYAALADGPQMSVKGDAALEDFKATTSGRGAANLVEELMSWKALIVPGIEFSLAPGIATKVQVREAALSDFYARLIVNPQGRLNLQDLVHIAPASPRQSEASTDPAAMIALGPITMVNGRVLFSDRFIQPNYTADLTGLTGRLSGISNQGQGGVLPLADLELRGRAQGTAALEIRGKLNPLAQPLALDINALASDLEMPPLSPYSIKYAGYGIERGKLSVDLHYTVQPDGQLTATNKLVLKQLTFGDKREGESASLPVKLAVALLADRDGMIDLDLPISGSLSDPQFRITTVLWAAVANLVGKAITAPFSLLAKAFSGGRGTELSTLAFAPGSARLSDLARAALDKVAHALQDRPTLRLTVVGFAHLQTEGEAAKREKLKGLLLGEKRRLTSSQGSDATQVIDFGAQEMPALLRSVYRRADITKPRNLAGQAIDIAVADMEALILANLSADEEDMRNLALQRALAVKEYLAGQQLPRDQLFLGPVNTGTAAADTKPQVELELAAM